MRISEFLNSIASWLESKDNEAILLAEYHDESLQKTAEGCVLAANILRKTAEEVDAIEPEEESHITPENLEELANIATAFDESGDPKLIKQAQLIDELLLTIAAPKDSVQKIKQAKEEKIDELKRKYQEIKKRLDEKHFIAEAVQDIEKAKIMQQEKAPVKLMSTRYCPDHKGQQVQRTGENEYTCDIDHKVYNYIQGFKMDDGTDVIGGEVTNQDMEQITNTESVFDTREERTTR